MRLDFNVLWIDDQPDNVVGNVERLEIKTLSEGFKLRVTLAKSFDEATPHLGNDIFKDNVDLVLVDYDLGVGTMGDVALQRIRRIVPYKDIVFYSAKPAADLKAMVLEQGVEGVFCAHREDLSDTLIGVFEALIKKVLDVDHCRGIVMGVTSDIDQLVKDSLLALNAQLAAEHAEAGVNYALEKLDEALEGARQVRDELAQSKSLEGLLQQHGAFTAVHKLGLLKKLLALHYAGEHAALVKCVGRYINEIPRKRNTLGHVRLIAEGTRRVLRGSDATEVSEAELRELRQKLIEYRDEFDKIAELLNLSLD